MIIRVRDKYYLILDPVSKRIISKLEEKNVTDTTTFRDIMEEFGRKKVYDSLRYLERCNIIDIKKTIFPRNKLIIKYYGRRVRVLDHSIIISSIISIIIYVISLHIIDIYPSISTIGFITGVLSSILLAMLLFAKLILDRLDIVK